MQMTGKWDKNFSCRYFRSLKADLRWSPQTGYDHAGRMVAASIR